MSDKMHATTFRDDVVKIKTAILFAIPTGVSFAAIIVALAEVIKVMQEQEIFGDD